MSYAGVFHEDFTKYRTEVVNYRNKYLIHREISIAKIQDGYGNYPRHDIAEKTILSLILLLTKIVQNIIGTTRNSYRVEYYDFKNKRQFIELIEKSCPKIHNESNNTFYFKL